jgi:endogenous inhibitor of DNA gyrase (YacG/DUF329 family)
MPRAKQSKGVCAYCGQEVAKGGVSKHLAACSARQAVIAEAEQRKTVKSETLHHLRVRDAWSADFWLDLEVRGSATLKHLDDYLRAIWLECCGHLSQFSVGGWGGQPISVKRSIGQVFEPGVELTHIYDFGTSSETLIIAVAVREGKPTTAKPIALMARNRMPEALCIECQQPAQWLCLECLTEKEIPGMLCDEHKKTHPHKDYGDPIALVNSPRLGMCGYTGPADPPY